MPRKMKPIATALAAVVALTSPFSFSTAKADMMRPVYEKQKTFLVNGLASVMPFVGYGFANLSQKLQDAKTYDYATPVEGRMVIQPMVFSEIKREYARDPSIKINLVGISYGANIVTSLASQLNQAGIPVNYLGVLDGPMLTAITPNVHRVDNFVCSMVGCIGQKARLARGNNQTMHAEFSMRSTHIALADNRQVHQRIMGQLTAYPLLIAGQPIDTVDTFHTASVQ